MSELKFMPELSAEEREDYLKSQAAITCTEQHYRPLTTGELDGVKDSFIENCDKINKIKEAISDKVKDAKDEIKVLEEENEQLMVSARSKQAEVVEKLYGLDDQLNGIMKFYNVDGLFIKSRRLLPEEKQLRIDRHGDLEA